MRNHRSTFVFLAAALFLAACADPPVDDPGDGDVWQLTDYLETATDLPSISGVYWSARAMEKLSSGNHHFITLIYRDTGQRDAICADFAEVGYQSWTNSAGLEVHYSTVSAFADTGELVGDLIESFCWPSDCLAVKQAVNPGEYLEPEAKNYRLEAHRVLPSQASEEYADQESLMRGVLEKAKNFNAHYDAGLKLAFELETANCAAMASSLFGVLGVSETDRALLGEFRGIDSGVGYPIPEEYFDTDFSH